LFQIDLELTEACRLSELSRWFPDLPDGLAPRWEHLSGGNTSSLERFVNRSRPRFPFGLESLPAGRLLGGNCGDLRVAGIRQRFDSLLFSPGAKLNRFGLLTVQPLELRPVQCFISRGYAHRVLIVFGTAFDAQVPCFGLCLAQPVSRFLDCVLELSLDSLQ